VLELSKPSIRLIGCFAQPSVLDQLHRDHLRTLDTVACGRVAPDEFLVLVPTEESARVVEELTDRLGSDPGAIVLDRSDAFYAITLSGPFRQALARLSACELPDSGFLQGLAAGVACKFFVTDDCLHLLASSTHTTHLRERIFVTCADLGVHEFGSSNVAESAVVASA